MEATVDKKYGKVLQTRDEILKYVLYYNREALAKEDAQGEWKVVEQAKIRDTRLLAKEDDEKMKVGEVEIISFQMDVLTWS